MAVTQTKYNTPTHTQITQTSKLGTMTHVHSVVCTTEYQLLFSTTTMTILSTQAFKLYFQVAIIYDKYSYLVFDEFYENGNILQQLFRSEKNPTRGSPSHLGTTEVKIGPPANWHFTWPRLLFADLRFCCHLSYFINLQKIIIK